MSGFSFKQFHINQERCAMKVGTDGILLGSWMDVASAKRMLDLGSDTGLIALMLAQGNRIAQITGVELNESAFLQAQENIQQSFLRIKFRFIIKILWILPKSAVKNLI